MTVTVKDPLCIYLSGNIKKGKEDENELSWTQEDMDMLQRQIPSVKLTFLNPASRSDDLSDQKSVFGRDLFQVYSSHLVFVDARGKRGLGVGAEMMFAKMHDIPVIAWLPENSHYHREHIHLLGQHVTSWIHPFVFNLSDYLAVDLMQAGCWINDFLLANKVSIKGPESIKEAMNYYLENQLQRDSGMHEMVQASSYLLDKVNQVVGIYV